MPVYIRLRFRASSTTEEKTRRGFGSECPDRDRALDYKELERKVVGVTATMLTKCLRELEQDQFITRTQYNTIPPTVEYALAERGKTLIPALESVYQWAEAQMK